MLTRTEALSFTCAGDGTHMHVFGSRTHDEITAGYPIAVDRVTADPAVRMNTPAALRRLTFRCVPPAKKSIRPTFSDCMMVYSGVDPLFYFDGFCSLVSQRAVECLAPVIGQEVEFIEVQVDGAPADYFVLWLRVIDDALDFGRSHVVEDPPGSNRFRIRRGTFRRQQSARYAFRLPAWRYAINADFVTRQFVAEVVRNGLTGFRFREGINGREVEGRAIVS